MTIIEAGKENLKYKEYSYVCPHCDCHFLYRKSDINASLDLNCPWCNNTLNAVDLFCSRLNISKEDFIKRAKQIRDNTGCSINSCEKTLLKLDEWDEKSFEKIENNLKFK